MNKGIPVLGVCVGMQIMSSSSREGDLDGLNWIKSRVEKFKYNSKQKLPIPHMGWNEVNPVCQSDLFVGLDNSIPS